MSIMIKFCDNRKVGNMSARETLKILLVKRNMTITKLAEELSKKTGQKYTRQSISSKLHRNSLRYEEMEEIAKLLDFKIEMIDLL